MMAGLSWRHITRLLILSRSVEAYYPYDLLECQTGMPAMRTKTMTTCQYHHISNAVISTWSALSSKCDEYECQQAAWAACVLRIAGHDFMDFKDGVGGSDGCTDMEADDSKGLECVYKGQSGLSLTQAYQPFCQNVSLADFIVIAAEAIMMATRRNVEGVEPLDFKSSFKFGRATATQCPEAKARLPNAEGSCSEVDRVFLQNLGLDWRGAAALSGVHTLGRAHPENSGYNGWWTGTTHAGRLDNMYFVSLLSRGWSPEKAVGGNAVKNQWRRSDGARSQTEHHMMLNTDMCFVHDDSKEVVVGFEELNAAHTDCCAWVVPVEAAGVMAQNHMFCGAPNVPPGFHAQRALCCDNNPEALDCSSPDGGGGKAYEIIKEFSQDDKAWIEALVAAWKKSTENGFEDELKELEPCDGTVGEEPGFTHFDCSAGEKYWERGWSELKKGFCCKNAGIGCEEEFDCEAGKSSWQTGWTETKKYKCCKQTGISCDEFFDCTSGADNWQRGWSVLKQTFCCQRFGIGCEGKYDAEMRFQDGQQTAPAYVMPLASLAVCAGIAFGVTTWRAWLSSRQELNQRIVEPEDSD